MNTIHCPSCEATFPEGAIRSPQSGPCPRCGQYFFAPRTASPAYPQPELGAIDLFAPSFCSICGCILTAIERTGGPPHTCQYPGCLQRRASIDGAAREMLDIAIAEEFVRAHSDLIERKARELEVALDRDIHMAILPAKLGKLVAMTEDRRTELATRLAELADEIDNDAHGPGETDTTAAPRQSPPLPAIVGHACATCRGYCCRHGGNRAYLTRATFERALAQSPTLSLEEMQEAYLSRVPRESYEGSCIFHGRTGCTLEPGMRSDTCNDYFCNGARRLPEDPREKRLAVAIDGRHVIRLAIIGAGGQTLLFEEE
jgi:hypothetical protein